MSTGYRIVRQFLSQGKNATGVWRCELCGCLVGHVDDHAAWHLEHDGIKYGELLVPVPDPETETTDGR